VNIKQMHDNFKMPQRSTTGSGGYDLYMPEAGCYDPDIDQIKHPLGFAIEVPTSHVALILPRSGVGFNDQLEINNTCGVIDSDYRGQWFARIRTKTGKRFEWEAGDRLLQMLIVPVTTPELVVVDELSVTGRGESGIGSTGA